MTLATTERFDIGRVIGRMFGVIGRNLAVFAGLALLLSGLPTALLGLARTGLLPSTGALDLGLSWSWLVNMLISAWLQAALIRGSISDLNGARASFGDCLGTATGDILPLIGVSLLATAICVMGLFFFIVPGIILALVLSVSAPVRVIERTGVFAALGRSGDLTRDHRGAIFLLFLLYGAGLFVGGIVLNLATAPLAFAGPAAVVIRAALVDPLVGAFTALIGAAGIASIYFELRTVKEGIGIEALAAVFD